MKDITKVFKDYLCPRDIKLPQDCLGTEDCYKCWRKALAGRRVYIETPFKPENRQNDKRKTNRGMFIPESPKAAEMDDFKANVDKSLNELNRGIMQLEREIHLLWREVEYLKGETK